MVKCSIRLGTPAVTTRGFPPKEMKHISSWIGEIVKDIKNSSLQERIRQEIRELCISFPVPA
jgi:glycine hydroxymethyltransferase